MRTTIACSVTAFAFLLAAVPAFAHHSFAAEFDVMKPVRLVGTVTKIEWTNPHAWFYIDVTDESGRIANWGWELGSPNGLMKAGWTRSSLKVGDLVTVEGSRSRDGGNTANARTVMLNSNGQKLFAASSQTSGQ